ncbi:MAG: PepSY domain-containing protein [Bacteroidetes bacterium]|nr:PepSY domain-containing protein [Bacteroidota bacterium]MDA1121497.1 PepSY domain-containing protein [Bacteroidota bacterium]
MEISIVSELGKIIEIEGQIGPFDYSLDPEGDFISLEEALEKALKEVKGGEIERWELEIEEDNKWEFEIHITNDEGRWEVEIDAFTGLVIKIKKKSFPTEEEKDFDRPHEEAPEEIQNMALMMVPGEVTHSQMKEDDDHNHWLVAIITPAGSLVKVRLTSSGELIRIKGEEAPFDYVV